MRSDAAIIGGDLDDDGESGCPTAETAEFRHSASAVRKTAALFSALGDSERLRVLEVLVGGRRCVGALAEEMDESMSLISQRLKILHHAELVVREREGRHVYYRVADEYVVALLVNGFDHASGTGR
jgi:ArsR family transcriptional regulator